MRRIKLCVLAALAIAMTGCSPLSRKEAADSEKTEGPQAAEMNVETGGRKVVKLSVPNPGQTDHAQMLSAEILPGRGMNIYQITAYLPGQGTVNILASPSLDEGAKILNEETDPDGILSYSFGGAVLVPFANRIRGKLSADGKTLTTTILGKKVELDANSKGKKPGAIPHAMHGLILKSPMDSVKESISKDSSSVTGNLDAGYLGGHWISKTELTIFVTLKPNS
ncbi:MAG: aldose 1-epimerase, partial [Bryobacteraceae bacterium]